MDRIKRVIVSNKDRITRKVLIFAGTGLGIAIAAYAYHRANQTLDGDTIIVEETTYEQTASDD